MFQIASITHYVFGKRDETVYTTLEKEFPTVKAAEYYARRRMASNKHRRELTKLRIERGAKYIVEVCQPVDEDGIIVNDHFWKYEEGIA